MILGRPTAFWKVINTNPNTAGKVTHIVSSDHDVALGGKALAAVTPPPQTLGGGVDSRVE